jgi:hypothetical protein
LLFPRVNPLRETEKGNDIEVVWLFLLKKASVEPLKALFYPNLPERRSMVKPTA